MDTLKSLSMAVAGAGLLTLGTVFTAQASTLTLESASLGSTEQTGGYSVSDNQFLAWSFKLNDTLQVTEIGGQISSLPEWVNDQWVTFGNGQLFGAIVPLSDSKALPQGNPFQPEEVLAWTTFIPNFPSTDITIPLSVTLDPGNYALIFGSGLFGASGRGFMPYNNVDLPGSSYFFWNTSFWSDVPFFNTRFVVEGESGTTTSVPETTPTLGILAFGALGASSVLKRRRKTENSK